MSQYKSDFLRVLSERGFIHQVSEPEALDERLRQRSVSRLDERASGGRVEPALGDRGKVRAVAVEDRARAGRDEQGHALVAKPARGEREGGCGGVVDPVRVVDDDQERAFISCEREEGQNRRADREAIPEWAVDSRECGLQGVTLR